MFRMRIMFSVTDFLDCYVSCHDRPELVYGAGRLLSPCNVMDKGKHYVIIAYSKAGNIDTFFVHTIASVSRLSELIT